MAYKAMRLKRIFRLTNNRIRLGVGIVLAALFFIQCNNTGALDKSELVTFVTGEKIGQTSPDIAAGLEELAKTDHVALLKRGLAHYDNSFQDYTCLFVKQERISGSMRPEQHIKVKFKERPFSVAMEWVKNVPLGDRVIYVEGKHNGMMLIRPKGIWKNILGTVARDPRSKQVMANTLRPVTQFGFRRSLQNLLEVYELAESRGEATNSFEGYKQIGDEKVLVLVRMLPARDDYPAKKTVVYLSVDHLVPLGVEGYDWDDQLFCSYFFKDVKFNIGLTDRDFTPEANGMKPLK